MIKYKIIWNDKSLKPSLDIEPDQGELWNLSELNSCNPEYIVNDVLPNLERIMRGEQVQDPTRLDDHLVDFYEFGYDATIIDFYRTTAIMNYGYWEGQISVNSEELYQLIVAWGDTIKEWMSTRQQ